MFGAHVELQHYSWLVSFFTLPSFRKVESTIFLRIISCNRNQSKVGF